MDVENFYSRILKRAMSAASVVLVILFSGCNKPPSIEETVAALKNMQPTHSDKPANENTQSNNSIPADSRNAPLDSVTYWKMVKDSCPELFRKDPLSPYEAYDKCKSGYMIGWGCEVGIDDYFQMYAKVMRKRSGKGNIPLRKETMEAMKSLNMLAGHLAGGGTFFGHSIVRVAGDLEYSLFQYEHGQMNFDDIILEKERKELFKSWRRNIRNSLKLRATCNDHEMTNAELELLVNETFKDVETLVRTPFTLTFIREYVHGYYNDFKYPLQ